METELPLRDIHLPAPIGWWPPAPGWWILLFGMPALAFLLAWLWRFLRRQSPKKLALRELESIAKADADPLEKVRQLAVLLRRTALSVYPREEVAGLVGEAWLAFLDAPLKTNLGRVGKGLFACPPIRRFLWPRSHGQTPVLSKAEGMKPFARPTRLRALAPEQNLDVLLSRLWPQGCRRLVSPNA